ncbi:SdhC [Trypoxylus dichotomus]
MAMFLRASNNTLVKHLASKNNLIMLARPVTMKVVEAPRKSVEDYDQFNTRIGRPLSPHLTIYKPQLTTFLSISHRAAGMALGGYLSILGIGAFVSPLPIDHCLDSLQNIGWFSHFLVKMCIALPICYHYSNGIRHLTWDMGKLLTIKQVYSSGYFIMTLTVLSALALSL